jgi:hypothetical protein
MQNADISQCARLAAYRCNRSVGAVPDRQCSVGWSGGRILIALFIRPSRPFTNCNFELGFADSLEHRIWRELLAMGSE